MAPQFNVDSDVLARSPIGSVTDLSNVIHSDSESIGGPASLEGGGAAAATSTAEAKEVSENADATEASSETKQEEGEGVGITVTSPHGTDRQPDEAEKKAAEENGEEDAAAGDPEMGAAATETVTTEFTNSQGTVCVLFLILVHYYSSVANTFS